MTAVLGKRSVKAPIQYTVIYGFYVSEVKLNCAASI